MARTEWSGPSIFPGPCPAAKHRMLPRVIAVKSLLARPSIHQALEYAVGFSLAGSSVRSPDRMLLVLAGLAVVANTAVLDGPLAAFGSVPRAVHRGIDMLLAAAGVWLAFAAGTAVSTRAVLLVASAVVAFASVRFVHVVRETRS